MANATIRISREGIITTVYNAYAIKEDLKAAGYRYEREHEDLTDLKGTGVWVLIEPHNIPRGTAAAEELTYRALLAAKAAAEAIDGIELVAWHNQLASAMAKMQQKYGT